MIKELTDLINAFANLNIDKYTLIFAVVIICAIIIFKFIDDNKQQKYYNDMKNEKNKEIERLADDNRHYREVYLNSLGMSKEQIANMSAVNMTKEG